jgi:hypothetical protein
MQAFFKLELPQAQIAGATVVEKGDSVNRFRKIAASAMKSPCYGNGATASAFGRGFD